MERTQTIDLAKDPDGHAAREARDSQGPAVHVANPAWYVVATKLRRERFAVEQLAQRRVETFLPRLAIDRRGTRVVRPLFPGYLFARLDLPTEWSRVVWSPGVRRLVTFEGEAPPVPPGAISYLRSQAGPDGVIVVRPRPLPVGHRVRVTNGPLAGLVGIIENPPDARGRVSVLMDILRTQTRVSIDVGWLEDA
jgi:transcriptional antiterminator RfaH